MAKKSKSLELRKVNTNIVKIGFGLLGLQISSLISEFGTTQWRSIFERKISVVNDLNIVWMVIIVANKQLGVCSSYFTKLTAYTFIALDTK